MQVGVDLEDANRVLALLARARVHGPPPARVELAAPLALENVAQPLGEHLPHAAALAVRPVGHAQDPDCRRGHGVARVGRRVGALAPHRPGIARPVIPERDVLVGVEPREQAEITGQQARLNLRREARDQVHQDGALGHWLRQGDRANLARAEFARQGRLGDAVGVGDVGKRRPDVAPPVRRRSGRPEAQ